MTKAKLGDRVQVQYLGLLKDGRSIPDPQGRQVLEFTVGSKEVMRGISFGVVGMAEGQEKRLSLTAEDAYGAVRAKLIEEVSRRRFPSHVQLHVGKRVIATGVESGRQRKAKVVELRADSVVVDGNHPLAGEAMEVELQLISVDSSASQGE